MSQYVTTVGGYALRIRPDTSDQGTFDDTFLPDRRWHRPPESVKPSSVLDLGANIGTTTVDFCELWPRAQVVAVEPDRDNYELLVENTRELGVRTLCAAVTPEPGKGHTEGDAYNSKRFVQGGDVLGLTITEILDMARWRGVDYIKMDIEGMERSVLNAGVHTRWPRVTGCIKVELHDDYGVEEGMLALQALGFQVTIDDSHSAALVGTR